MDHGKMEMQLARGLSRWQAARLKPVVKRLGVAKIKKPKRKKGAF